MSQELKELIFRFKIRAIGSQIHNIKTSYKMQDPQ
jgi:hypothetical protein